MFSVMCGLSCFCLWLSVVHIFMLFCFFTADIYTFIYFYIISKGIFHIGGLVSKMHISVTGYLRNGSASVFCSFCFLHLLCTILGL